MLITLNINNLFMLQSRGGQPKEILVAAVTDEIERGIFSL